MKRLAGILVVFATLASCQVRPASLRPILETEGMALVYLQPIAGDSGRLEFSLKSIAALTADGDEIPLSVALGEVSARKLTRERMLAHGPVPPGSFSGLSLSFGAVSTASRTGDADLHAPDSTVRVDLPFVVERRRAVVLSLRLDASASLTAGYSFTPVFSGSLPARPAIGVTAIAASCDADTLTVFDKTQGRVAAVVPAGDSPRGVDLDPVRLRGYVALSGNDAVEVVDLQQYRSIERVQLFGGDRPVELALTRDRRSLLVVNAGSDTLSILDPSSLSERNRLVVGDEPSSLAVDDTGRRAYVFNTLSSSISVVDLVQGVLLNTIPTEAGPIRGQLDRLGDRLYVIHGESPYLSVIDTRTLETIERVYVGHGATALKVDPRTDRIYVARQDALAVDVYDPFSLLPIDSIPVPGEVSYMAIDDEGNNLGLVLPRMNEVHIVRLVGKDTVARIDVGDGPCWTSFLGER